MPIVGGGMPPFIKTITYDKKVFGYKKTMGGKSYMDD